jgi:hypothetical protein
MIARKLEMKKKAARGAALFVHDKQRIGMGKSMRGRTQRVFFCSFGNIVQEIAARLSNDVPKCAFPACRHQAEEPTVGPPV